MMTMTIRKYSDLIKHSSFNDRYHYLALRGEVGSSTFGFDRYINQRFYTSREWKDLRSFVIMRDNGCDLGVFGYEIHDRVYIHHMNPITREQLLDYDPDTLDPEYLITTTHRTHNAIHFGDERLLVKPYVPRRKNDTKLW